jgi:hypothetical protein
MITKNNGGQMKYETLFSFCSEGSKKELHVLGAIRCNLGIQGAWLSSVSAYRSSDTMTVVLPMILALVIKVPIALHPI